MTTCEGHGNRVGSSAVARRPQIKKKETGNLLPGLALFGYPCPGWLSKTIQLLSNGGARSLSSVKSRSESYQNMSMGLDRAV